MPQINLTRAENNMLYGFIQGVLEIVEQKTEMELEGKENTTALLKSVLSKVQTELINQTN